jgi:hypothetical protein
MTSSGVHEELTAAQKKRCQTVLMLHMAMNT